jgi:hypothetical protein
MDAAMEGDAPSGPAPVWLRLLILAVTLWLGVRILQNVTDMLSGIAGDVPTAAAPERAGNRHAAASD